MKEEEKLQSMYLEFQMIDQQIKELEKQSIAINDHVMELMLTNQSLGDMEKIKPGTEILVPLSGGIYAKAELKDNKSFIVNIGSNAMATKDLQSTKELIEDQIKDVKKIQENITTHLQIYTEKAASLEQEMNKVASSAEEKKE
jgi:prefoldin alpha subunit